MSQMVRFSENLKIDGKVFLLTERRPSDPLLDVVWSSSQGTMMMVKSGQLWIRKHNLSGAVTSPRAISVLSTRAREAREQRSTLDHDLHGSGELFQEHLPQRFLFFWHFVQAIPRAGDWNLLDLVPKHGKANTLSSKYRAVRPLKKEKQHNPVLCHKITVPTSPSRCCVVLLRSGSFNKPMKIFRLC